MHGNVDLHIHSCASDGTMTVDEIIENARLAGVGLLAISDHNTVESSRELCRRRPEGLCCIPAVEIDCLHEGCHLHVLGYGIDLDDQPLNALITHNRRELDGMSERLVTALGLSLDAFRAFEYDRRLGGWAGLHFLKEQGAIEELTDAFALHAQIPGCGYETARFPALEAVVAAIHAAGGKAVAAHAGYTLRTLSLGRLIDFVEALIPLGLDGLECYYPHYAPGVTEALLAVCKAHDLLITTGADTHGEFDTRTHIGMLQIPRDLVRLSGIRSTDGVL